MLDFDFDAFVLGNGEVVADDDTPGMGRVIVNGDAVSVCDAANIALQQISLVHRALDQLAFDLDIVIDAQEDFELFARGRHFHLSGADVLAAQEDAGLALE